ncbi:hypothetical protein APHAL10511_003815 [Amanita phalloides]|nr:hypothetical protein APHAL10511_003815 [Amanita phalloides]
MTVDTQSTPFSPAFGPELVEDCTTNSNDPPPPYPSREQSFRSARSAGTRSNRRRHTQSMHATLVPEPGITISSAPYANTDDDALAQGSSVASAAPSLAQTILSLFNDEYVCEDTRNHARTNEEFSEETRLLDSSRDVTRGGYGYDWAIIDNTTPGDRRQRQQQLESSHEHAFFSLAAWKRYFVPMTHLVYYKALFHLLVVNFPYALVAWLYLFIFTLTGTTLLMALPLGAVLCFLNLLGARAFARGELALQSRFHSPLAYPPPYPPRPIFTRTRPPTAVELEMGITTSPETSFYKNTYAMFTDSTTYQALFYFIVIKPSITILLSLFLIIFVLPAMVLIIPAPAMLRAVRRLGAWQANVAIEGLYIAVR